MIRKSLETTKRATFVVNIPDQLQQGFPRPSGTGFFISPDGYFITANHVVKALTLGDSISLLRPTANFSEMISGVRLIKNWPIFDLAILKAEFEENKQKEHLKDRKDFPHLQIDSSEQEEGAPVYAFGYPLMESSVEDKGNFMLGFTSIPSRTTSAIISSNREVFGSVAASSDPKFYIIDKALNYGNSGGPIVMTETGRVISVCVRFQPQIMKGEGHTVPSLYGVTSSLQNIEEYLNSII